MTWLVFGDPGELHAIAHRITSHADQVRAQATALAAATATTRWHSAAAADFRQQAAAIVRDLRRAAGELDDAATAMRRHAEAVGAALGRLAHDVGTVVRDVDRVGSAVVGGLERAGAGVLHAVGL